MIPPSQITIIVDSREQAPFTFAGMQTETAALPHGDVRRIFGFIASKDFLVTVAEQLRRIDDVRILFFAEQVQLRIAVRGQPRVDPPFYGGPIGDHEHLTGRWYERRAQHAL